MTSQRVDEWIWAMFEPTPTWPNVDLRQLFMWIEQSHIWPFRLNTCITFGLLQKLNPGYEICIISYQVNLSSEVSAMFNSLMPSLNSRSMPFVVFMGGFPSRCQNLSSGAIRPGGLLLLDVLGGILHCIVIVGLLLYDDWGECSEEGWGWKNSIGFRSTGPIAVARRSVRRHL